MLDMTVTTRKMNLHLLNLIDSGEDCGRILIYPENVSEVHTENSALANLKLNKPSFDFTETGMLSLISSPPVKDKSACNSGKARYIVLTNSDYVEVFRGTAGKERKLDLLDVYLSSFNDENIFETYARMTNPDLVLNNDRISIGDTINISSLFFGFS